MANTSLQDLQKIISTNTAALKKSNKKLGNVYQSYANGLVNNGAIQAIENARQNMQNTTNRQYDDSARNYYAQYRRNEANLPARLSALGITGGASETAQLGLMSNYSGNLYNNESARANALNTGNMQYDQMIAENSQNLANQLAETYFNLALQAREEALAKAASRSGGGRRRSRRGSRRYYGGGYGGSSSGLYNIDMTGYENAVNAVNSTANATAKTIINALSTIKKTPKTTTTHTGSSGTTHGGGNTKSFGSSYKMPEVTSTKSSNSTSSRYNNTNKAYTSKKTTTKKTTTNKITYSKGGGGKKKATNK